VTDHITLTGLRVRGNHGVFEHERRDGQEFVVDVRLDLAGDVVARAAASDDLADTADYGALAGTVAAIVAGEPVQLLETLAERIAAACLSGAGARVSAVTVTVHKPGAPIPFAFDDVAVTVVRPGAAGSTR